MKNVRTLLPEHIQERIVMTHSPIFGVQYQVQRVNVENEVDQWEPEEGESFFE